MKTIFTFLLFAAFSLGVSAQLTSTFNFEYGLADTCWHIFANGAATSEDDVTMAANPDKTEVNMSDSVIQFVVAADANQWSGIYTDQLEEPLLFNDDAHTLTMMVYKSIISPCAMKVEVSKDGGANMELKVENTLVDEWELLTFDLSTAVGYASGYTYPRLTVFPDFPDTRTEGTVVFMDNFSSPGADVFVKHHAGIKTILYPNPATDVLFVQHPEMSGITISNLLGKTVKNQKFETVNSKFFDVNDLQTGVYFLSVESRTGTFTMKFVKK